MPGDCVLIEETGSAQWRDVDFIGRLVVVASPCGPMIGRYQPPHLVRAGDRVAMVSEMEIVGVVQGVMRELGHY